jgi:hypothetical protein
MRLPIMLRFTGSALLVLIVLLFADRPAAQATSLTFEFDITATSGPLTGISSSGNFSFDDSIIPVGGGTLLAVGLLTDLQFSWNNINYDETSANTGFIDFDASGTFNNMCFGNSAGPGSCSVAAGTNQWFVVLSSNGSAGFTYGIIGDSGIGAGTGTYRSVPEPSTLLLLGAGLVGLAAWRWKHTA